jgi:C1A family cysteine protease
MFILFIILFTPSSAIVTYRENHLSKLLPEEFHKMYLNDHILSETILHTKKYSSISSNSLPEHLDWRTRKSVNPIRNQGRCGSCWAFATVAAVETSVAINQGELMDLSEQQLVDCVMDNSGCNGGAIIHAIKYIQSNGICTEKYHSNKTCQNCSIRAEISDFHSFSGEGAMMTAIQSGLLISHINATQLQNYGGGIIDNTVNCSQIVNHAVNIIGYGTENGVKYWIGRNSWGDDWGEKGYFRIIRGVNHCGIELLAYWVNSSQIAPNDYYPPDMDEWFHIYLIIMGMCALVLIGCWGGFCTYMRYSKYQSLNEQIDI